MFMDSTVDILLSFRHHGRKEKITQFKSNDSTFRSKVGGGILMG